MNEEIEKKMKIMFDRVEAKKKEGKSFDVIIGEINTEIVQECFANLCFVARFIFNTQDKQDKFLDTFIDDCKRHLRETYVQTEKTKLMCDFLEKIGE